MHNAKQTSDELRAFYGGEYLGRNGGQTHSRVHVTDGKHHSPRIH
jgi:hypothetical protein